MKKFKKILALVMALMMVLVGSALAADTTPATFNNTTTGVISGAASTSGSVTTYSALSNTLQITKEIVVMNPDSGTVVYYPSITYTYTLSSANPNSTSTSDGTTTTNYATVTDNNNKSATVYAGLADAVSEKTQTVSFAPSTTTGNGETATTQYNTISISSGNASITKSFSYTFDTTKFEHAGIYRYKISETASSTSGETTTDLRAIAGIEKKGTGNGDSSTAYADDRYLDVYVQNKSEGGFEIYGYVLFEGSSTDSITASNSTKKSNGYVNTATSGDPTDVDVYQTYNINVSKSVTGALGDKTHPFPFEITLANSTETATALVGVTAKDSTKATLDTTTDSKKVSSRTATAGETTTTYYFHNATGTFAATLKDGGTVSITGIPKNATVSVKETNDTNDVYTATGKNGTTELKFKSTATDGTNSVTMTAITGTAELNTGVNVNATSTQTIAITNNLDAISPTGYVTRFAPYALILVAGIALLVVAMKKRKTSDED